MDIAQKNNVKNILYIILTSLTAVLASALILFGALLFFYTVAVAVALKSPMATIVVLAAGALSCGAGLALSGLFFKMLKKSRAALPSRTTDGHSDTAELQSDSNGDTPKTRMLKGAKALSLTNAGLAIMLIGSVLAIVSAFQGSTERDTWVNAKTDFMEQNGYYADIKPFIQQYDVSGYDEITTVYIELSEKKASVVYDSTPSVFITVSGYNSYKNQISCSYNNLTGELRIGEIAPPPLSGTLPKLFFFMFDENKLEQNVQIRIPVQYSALIEIVQE